MKGVISIHIRCLDNSRETMYQNEIEQFRYEPRPFSEASYIATDAIFGVLYGSI